MTTQTNHDATVVAILISTQSPTHHEAETLGSLRELEHLVSGLGIHVCATLSQRRTDPLGAIALGRGKLEELRLLLEERRAVTGINPLLIFDGQLSPGQQRHLVRELGAEVLDRTQIILRVFRQRARTRTAQLEIELAELRYELPRIRDSAFLASKQGGGGGRGEKGHTSVELRKQQLRKRLARVEEELKTVASVQRTRRKHRDQLARVALLGYTNAGKSSWMRALTGADVLVEDALALATRNDLRGPATSQRRSNPEARAREQVGQSFRDNSAGDSGRADRCTLRECLRHRRRGKSARRDCCSFRSHLDRDGARDSVFARIAPR